MILKVDMFPDSQDLLMTTYKSTSKDKRKFNRFLDLVKRKAYGSLMFPPLRSLLSEVAEILYKPLQL